MNVLISPALALVNLPGAQPAPSCGMDPQAFVGSGSPIGAEEGGFFEALEQLAVQFKGRGRPKHSCGYSKICEVPKGSARPQLELWPVAGTAVGVFRLGATPIYTVYSYIYI